MDAIARSARCGQIKMKCPECNYNYPDGCDATCDYKHPMPEWISVKDRLPENKQWVLCVNANSEMFSAEYRRIEVKYSPGYLDIWDSGHCCGREPDNPTYWMPLPNSPGLPE